MSKVYVIGGMAMDIEGKSDMPIVSEESNPGLAHNSHGGVGRNICENLANLGAETAMVSVVGDDDMGKSLLRHLFMKNVDVDNVHVYQDERTAMYLSIMDSNGELYAAIASMEIFNRIDKRLVDETLPKLDDAVMVSLDTNMSRENLLYGLRAVSTKAPVFVDAVSAAKAGRLKEGLEYVHTLKANRNEISSILGWEIKNQDDVKKAGEELIRAGVKRAFITMGKDGAYYREGEREGFVHSYYVDDVASATGAGDAFSAMAIYGYVNGFDIEKTARYAIAASAIAIECSGAVSEKLSIQYVEEFMENSRLR